MSTLQAPTTAAALEVTDLHVTYTGKTAVHAVRGVDFTLPVGNSTAIVGESGCGKSSLARAICGLQPASAGSVAIGGRRVAGPNARRNRPTGDVQMIFQDPRSSLNPTLRVREIVSEPLVLRGVERSEAHERAAAMLERCGMPRTSMDRRPDSFSGGQRQRIAIARALVGEPQLVVCDEAVSALDVSVQAQILNLLKELRQARTISMLFITHDLGVVREIADDVLVMYAGRIIEARRASDLFDPAAPLHPYTAALFSAAPGSPLARIAPALVIGEVDSDEDSACAYRSRCWLSRQLNDPNDCRQTAPPRANTEGVVSCHHASSLHIELERLHVAGGALNA